MHWLIYHISMVFYDRVTCHEDLYWGSMGEWWVANHELQKSNRRFYNTDLWIRRHPDKVLLMRRMELSEQLVYSSSEFELGWKSSSPKVYFFRLNFLPPQTDIAHFTNSICFQSHTPPSYKDTFIYFHGFWAVAAAISFAAISFSLRFLHTTCSAVNTRRVHQSFT